MKWGRASGAVATAAKVPIPVEEDQRREATAQFICSRWDKTTSQRVNKRETEVKMLKEDVPHCLSLRQTDIIHSSPSFSVLSSPGT